MEKINFKHSGRLGDIVYSLPAVIELCRLHNATCDFYIASDTYIDKRRSAYHPGDGLMVSKALFEILAPVLKNLQCIKEVYYEPHGNIPTDIYDLDDFGRRKFNNIASHQPAWWRKLYGININFHEPWLKNSSSKKEPRYIVVSKSTRFYNSAINYQCLDQMAQHLEVVFLGLPFEFEHFKKTHGLQKLKLFIAEDGGSLMDLLQSAQLLIGNQSFIFSLAEGLKVPRALETFHPAPTVVPCGGVCTEFAGTAELIYFINTYFNFEKINAANYLDFSAGFAEDILSPPKLKFKYKLRKLINHLRGK